MIYEYECPCGKKFERWLPVAMFDDPQHCECGQLGRRLITGGSGFMGEKVEDAQFNPGLGCVTRSAKHRKEIAKRKGLEEVGTESPDKIHSKSDRDREEIRQRRWDEVQV